jgi:hypothetical protein
LNNPSKIDVKLSVDAKLPGDGLGAHAHGRPASFASAPSIGCGFQTQSPFNADFRRSSIDLIVSKDDREPVLQDYSEARSALRSVSPWYTSWRYCQRAKSMLGMRVKAGGCRQVISRIETAIGSLTRAGGITIQAKVGDPCLPGRRHRDRSWRS